MDEEFEFRVIFESLFLGINLERLSKIKKTKI